MATLAKIQRIQPTTTDIAMKNGVRQNCDMEGLLSEFKHIEEFIEKSVEKDIVKFVTFFNEAQAINTRLHQFELLPGFGKKHTQAILDAREEKLFDSFEDLKKRVSNLPDPSKAIEKRIMEELTQIQRNNLFII